MRKLLLLGCALVAPSLVFGQLTPFEVGVGYGQSGTFTKDSGGRGKLEGPVISISQSLLSLPAAGEVRVGASALLGTSGGADGNVYRVFARYRTPSLGMGLYGTAGVHWAYADGRSGSFDKVSRIGGDIGVGIPLGPTVPVLPKATLEVLSHQSARSQLRGWSATLTIRL
jgi:hypothetical protein